MKKSFILFLALAMVPGLLSAAAAKPARDRSGVYQKYEPAPAKTPVSQPVYSGTRVSLHKASWAIAAKGGLGLPLGETADYNEGGFSGGLSVYYRAAPMLSMDLFGLYMAAPYKDKQASEPLALMGGGLRALYHPFKMKQMTPHLGAGLGYMSARRATAVPQLDAMGNPKKDPVTGDVINDVVYDASGGLVFSGAVGATYELYQDIGVQVELSIYSISLAGGTSDSLMTALAGLGLQYSF